MKRILLRFLRLVLGGLFIGAGMVKLRTPVPFATEVANYQLAPHLAPVIAVVLPPIEVMLGLAVLLAPLAWRRAGALGMAVMLGLFTAATGSALARGINVECGCFGGGSGPITALTIVRDLALLAAAVGLFWLDRPRTAARMP